jgi:hypothetical protein
MPISGTAQIRNSAAVKARDRTLLLPETGSSDASEMQEYAFWQTGNVQTSPNAAPNQRQSGLKHWGKHYRSQVSSWNAPGTMTASILLNGAYGMPGLALMPLQSRHTRSPAK